MTSSLASCSLAELTAEAASRGFSLQSLSARTEVASMAQKSAPRVSTVDPTGASIKRFLKEDAGGPVVMLNLLRFKPDGRSSYAAYMREIEPFTRAAGAKLLYAGDCSSIMVAPAEHQWDALLLVRYPSRVHMARMIADPAYQKVSELRTQALSHAVLQATTPWSLPQAKL